MKILVDMNLSPAWAKFLSDKGYPAVHWSSIGSGNANDREIMAHAARHGFVLFTHDLDFGAILAATHGKGPSVIQIRADNLTTAAIGNLVLAALLKAENDLKDGALITIERHRTRLRVLPLKPAS